MARRLPTYPAGTVRALLGTRDVTPATRKVLEERLAAPPRERPEFFDAHAFATLRALCTRLLALDEDPIAVDVAGAIDERLAKGDGDGWRYASLPPDGECYVRALAALDATSTERHGRAFVELNHDEQMDVIERVRLGAEGWPFDSRRFFEEVLAESCERFYSHPLAYDEIGFAGFADAHGWQALGLGVLAPREPRSR